MSIEVITTWFNERFLAPFFLHHYSWADHIRVIDDVESTDHVEEIASKYPKASLEKIQFPSGFDNDIAVAKLNQCYQQSQYDWVIAVDADEFILPESLLSAMAHDSSSDIFYVRLFQVYRVDSDHDLDLSLSIMTQRRHGDANGVKGRNHKGMKPIVVRTGHPKLKWQPGQHNIWNRHKYITSEKIIQGAHWMMADPCFAIERRMRGVARQSEANRIRGNSSHYNTLTEEQVRKELEEHRHDPQLF